MKIRSLGVRSELFFLRHQAEVEDRGEYLVCRSPAEPGYHWGNLLLFPEPPVPGDYARWTTLWESEFGGDPRVRHVTFSWDGSDSPQSSRGEVAEFEAEGFEYDDTEVLIADQVGSPPHPTPGVEVRPLAGDQEWAAAIECGVLCRQPQFSAEEYRVFVTRRLAAQRALVKAGAGVWLGAFLDGALVADLGLFLGEGIARYQSVQTHPDHRRKGLCGTLVAAAAAYGRDHLGAKVFVMMADADYHAARIYKSVGFELRERLGGLVKQPPKGAPDDCGE